MSDQSIPTDRGADEGRLPGLARRAVHSVAGLGLTDVEQIAHRLYCYHRIPWGPYWSRTLPDPALLLASAHGWRRPVPVHRAGGWLSLSRQGARDDVAEVPEVPDGPDGADGADAADAADGPDERRNPLGRIGFGYKLYLSPAPGAVAEVLPVAADAAARVGALRFKVGADPVGLLRPDKIVFYVHDATALAELAGALTAALAGAEPHGVPFTAPLTDDGLLSWAGDPPGEDRQSWRMAVCALLAAPLARGVAPDVALAGVTQGGVVLPDFSPAALAPPTVPRRAA